MRNRYVFLADIAAIGVAAAFGAFVMRFDWRFFRSLEGDDQDRA